MDAQYSELFHLPATEKLRLVEELWDSIALSNEPIPVPDWQKEELAKRKAAHLENPEAAIFWEQVRTRIRRPS